MSDQDISAQGPLRSVAWLHVRDGRLLSVRTQGRDVFYLPGGKYEPGESGPQALVRELREEIGVTVDPGELTEHFVIHDIAHGQGGRPLHMTCFTGGPETIEPRPGREIAELAWMGPADMDRCAPAHHKVVQRLIAQGLMTA